MVGHEQEKLEPPPAVQEEGRFTLMINDGGLQGWHLTPPPYKGLLFRLVCRQGLSWGSVPRQSYPQWSRV